MVLSQNAVSSSLVSRCLTKTFFLSIEYEDKLRQQQTQSCYPDRIMRLKHFCSYSLADEVLLKGKRKSEQGEGEDLKDSPKKKQKISGNTINL